MNNRIMSITSFQRLKQRGAGMMGIAFILIVVGFSGKMIFAALPFYDEYSGIVRSVNQLQDKPDTKTMSGTKLKNALLNILYVNSVRTINHQNFKEHFYLKKTSTGKEILIKYQRETPMFSNVFMVIKYETTVIL